MTNVQLLTLRTLASTLTSEGARGSGDAFAQVGPTQPPHHRNSQHLAPHSFWPKWQEGCGGVCESSFRRDPKFFSSLIFRLFIAPSHLKHRIIWFRRGPFLTWGGEGEWGWGSVSPSGHQIRHFSTLKFVYFCSGQWTVN